ncbi:MAG TPA: BtrH N-terminal domain-containing protein [Ktedonobacteraceae bacterium]|nr:BtrH N-terminal domain-containing protein [Ktedonobacteraceae bacterium]
MKHILAPMAHWHHDLCSCLQCCMASVMHYYGRDPILTLGAVWDFYYSPEDLRKEEFYSPCRWSGLAESLLPYHPVTSRWHQPDDPEVGWLQVKEVVQNGSPVIVAVDNFYLPFRPAYQDIHAGHLILVYGFDEETDQVYVLDSMPPAFIGPIALTDLKASRSSLNPADERDYFFSNAPVANRWLELNIEAPFPQFTEKWVMDVINANLRRFTTPCDGSALSGMSGLARYFDLLDQNMANPAGHHALEELYVLGWSIQAATALHADFLMQVGKQLNWPRLGSIGRQVAHLAHHWTALRMLGAHGRAHPRKIRERLMLRATQLLADQKLVINQLQVLLEDLNSLMERG